MDLLAPVTWGNVSPPSPTLRCGDAPWAPGNEVWNGLLWGIQVYNAYLSEHDLLAEAARPRSTALGRADLWYKNLAPALDDISDRSGHSHQPELVGIERPALWKQG